MSSHNDYGSINANKVEVANQVVFHGATDNTNEVTLNCADPASDYQVDMPTSAGTLLTDNDNIALTQVDINGASEETTPADAHEIAVYDGAANKKMSLANLKTLAGIALPSTSVAGELLISDGSDYNSTSISGDIAVDGSGVATINADAVEKSMIEDAPTTDGTCEASKFVVTDASNNLASLNDLGCANVEASNQLQAPQVEFGSGANRWRIKQDASNNLEFQFSNDSGATYTTLQVFNNA